jgi:hypothetical protein
MLNNPLTQRAEWPPTKQLITVYNRLLHMPINIDRFEDESEDFLDIKEGTQPHTILTFLTTNDEQAFTQTEIHEATGILRGSVGVVLSRLEEQGLVRHRGRYWAIAADERLGAFAAQDAASSASTTDDYYGETDE